MFSGTFLDRERLVPNKRAELIPNRSEFKLGVCHWTFKLEAEKAQLDQSSLDPSSLVGGTFSSHIAYSVNGQNLSCVVLRIANGHP